MVAEIVAPTVLEARDRLAEDAEELKAQIQKQAVRLSELREKRINDSCKHDSAVSAAYADMLSDQPPSMADSCQVRKTMRLPMSMSRQKQEAQLQQRNLRVTLLHQLRRGLVRSRAVTHARQLASSCVKLLEEQKVLSLRSPTCWAVCQGQSRKAANCLSLLVSWIDASSHLVYCADFQMFSCCRFAFASHGQAVSYPGNRRGA